MAAAAAPPALALALVAALLGGTGDAEAARRRHRHADAGADAPQGDAGAGTAEDGGTEAGPPRDPNDPGCLYGRMIDGHTGRVRCLSPEEVSAQAPYAQVDGGAPLPVPKEERADAGGAPLVVSVGGVTFQGGEVPRLDAVLGKLAKKELAACTAQPEARPGQVTLSFLVRVRGRAEGVEVAKSRGVPTEVAKCMAGALARRPVGHPSADPVGVEVVLDVARGP